MRRVLRKDLDVAAFEAEVGNWLANSGVEADDPLSLDGKTLRGVHGQEIPGVHLVSAYASRAGAVLAQVAAAASSCGVSYAGMVTRPTSRNKRRRPSLNRLRCCRRGGHLPDRFLTQLRMQGRSGK